MTLTYATSDDTWPDFICATCGGAASDTDNSGVIVRGGYGSARYDTSSLVWVVRGEDVYPQGCICDDCIDRAVSDSRLEEFHTSLGDKNTGLHLSEAAYAELFAHGARQAYDAFWAKREAGPYHEARAPEALEAAVEDMRHRLSGDGVLTSSSALPRSPLGWGAVNIGYAHAVAAIAFGCGEADPGFAKASEKWSRARKALEADLDECWQSSEEMFAALRRDVEPDDGTA